MPWKKKQTEGISFYQTNGRRGQTIWGVNIECIGMIFEFSKAGPPHQRKRQF
jgi:hypothetical protein